MGESLTLWSVRLALVGYAIGAAITLSGARRPAPQRTARMAWSLGCALFILHVLAAFAVYHHWSHAAAYDHTAARTADTVGVRTGVGLYINYLFAAAWVADVAYWWVVGCERYLRRPRAVTYALHGFFLFMVFNATVVFATGVARWLGAAITLAVLAATVAGRRHASSAHKTV